MTSERFNVVFQGEIAEGLDQDTVKGRLATLLGVENSQVDRLFDGGRYPLKKNVDQATASKYRQALEATGARCQIVPVVAPTPSIAKGGNTHPAAASHSPAPFSPPPQARSMDARTDNNASNIYAPPSADLDDDGQITMIDLSDPQRLPTGQGWVWIVEGWHMFRDAPGTWIGLVIGWIILLIVLSLIPLVNIIVQILGPVFIGGIMIGCLAQDEGEGLRVGHLFAGFGEQVWRLAGLGGLYLLFTLGIGLVFGMIFLAIGGGMYGMGMDSTTAPNAESTMIVLIMLAALIVLVLSIPLMMAFWFAPVLVALHDVAVFDSLLISFRACWRNILPFLIYGLIALGLMIVASIPLGLGFLVLGPVLLASVYTSHKAIFFGSL